MKQKFIDLYMNLAESVSQMSTAVKLKVGTVIVKDHTITYGYNGTPSGWDNNCETVLPDGSLKTKPEVLHSEANALSKIAKSTVSSEGATLFCTHAPCIDCAKMIHQAGIFSVYYRNEYKSTDGINFLEKSGITIQKA
jgi:dCMP deaminase